MQQRHTGPSAGFRRSRAVATALALLLALLLLTTHALGDRPASGPSATQRSSLAAELLHRATRAVLPPARASRYSSRRSPVPLGSRN